MKQLPQQNHLLAALPGEVQGRLFPHLENISLPLGKVLYESGDVMQYVYFPTDSIVSLLYVMENGASAEISVVGNEGVVGIALFMGGESTPSRAIVQSAGYAFRLPGQKLKDEFNRDGGMRLLLLRYTQALITQMAQTAVCNRHHSIDQQLCRWLLLSLDRLSGPQLCMTQELIANMLGVRREGVTDAAGKLQGVVKCAGSALRMSVEQLGRAISDSPALLITLNKYLYLSMVQASQASVCNYFHEIQPRLARWLLMTHDRVQTASFNITHEYLAEILGVRRSSITVAAGSLQQKRLIEYSRGEIRILNRKGLETVSCDCYAAMNEEYGRLLGPGLMSTMFERGDL